MKNLYHWLMLEFENCLNHQEQTQQPDKHVIEKLKETISTLDKLYTTSNDGGLDVMSLIRHLSNIKAMKHGEIDEKLQDKYMCELHEATMRRTIVTTPEDVEKLEKLEFETKEIRNMRYYLRKSKSIDPSKLNIDHEIATLKEK